MTTTRGPGQFIGEASLFEGGRGDATWKTSVRAKGKVRALLLTRSHLRSLLRQRPEAEAAVRAGAILFPHHRLLVQYTSQAVPSCPAALLYVLHCCNVCFVTHLQQLSKLVEQQCMG